MVSGVKVHCFENAKGCSELGELSKDDKVIHPMFFQDHFSVIDSEVDRADVLKCPFRDQLSAPLETVDIIGRDMAAKERQRRDEIRALPWSRPVVLLCWLQGTGGSSGLSREKGCANAVSP